MTQTCTAAHGDSRAVEPGASGRETVVCRIVSALIAIQLLFIGVVGLTVAVRLHVWAFADERAHAAYVDAVAMGHLPVLGKDAVPAEIGHLGGTPQGLAGASYEAFQPPLYYVLASVPWAAAKAIGSPEFAVRVLRVLNLLALGVTLAVLWRLALRVGRSRLEARVAYAVALTFICWPGVIFRSVTISNTAMEMPLASGAVLALWVAWTNRSSRALMVASGLCGLGLLCRLPFPPVVLLPVVAWRLRKTAPGVAAAAVVLPLIMLAPWLVDNLHRYGAVTAVSLMKAMQGGFLNPGDRPYGVTRLAHADVALLNGMLPEEWANTTLTLYRTGNSLPLSVLHLLRGALVVLLAGPLALWVVRGPRRLWLLVAPLLVGLVLTQLETVIVRLPLDQPRYLYPTLPAAGLLAGITCVRSAGVRLTTALAGALTIGLAGLWLYLATVPTLPGS